MKIKKVFKINAKAFRNIIERPAPDEVIRKFGERFVGNPEYLVGSYDQYKIFRVN